MGEEDSCCCCCYRRCCCCSFLDFLVAVPGRGDFPHSHVKKALNIMDMSSTNTGRQHIAAHSGSPALFSGSEAPFDPQQSIRNRGRHDGCVRYFAGHDELAGWAHRCTGAQPEGSACPSRSHAVGFLTRQATTGTRGEREGSAKPGARASRRTQA